MRLTALCPTLIDFDSYSGSLKFALNRTSAPSLFLCRYEAALPLLTYLFQILGGELGNLFFQFRTSEPMKRTLRQE